MVDYTALAGSFDLFELMVNYVAGSILLPLVIWAGIILITGIFYILTGLILLSIFPFAFKIGT